jgi:hypothetical protein
VRRRRFGFTTPVADEQAPDDHALLSDDQLIEQLRRRRRESAEWAAALAEVHRRADRLHGDERFREALDLAVDRPPARDEPPVA